MASVPPPVPQEPPPPQELEEEEEGEDEEEEEDNSSDSDIEANALELSRRLDEELWAMTGGGVSKPAALPATAPVPQVSTVANATAYAKAEEAALGTIKTILQLVMNDPLAKSILSATIIPGLGSNVFDVLQQSTSNASVAKTLAVPLSQVLVTLARSEQLFGSLRHSDASAVQLQQGKRKWGEMEGSPQQEDDRLTKRPFAPDEDLQKQLSDAVRAILQAIATATTPSPLDPTVISSIQLQLHQVFLFAVTCSTQVGRQMQPLQEVSALIQVIGILSGIPIGNGSEASSTSELSSGQGQTPATDIGTAVYPCLISGCKKVFSRLYDLRAHQRDHALHRTFRCSVCPASFVRHHDLKRHVKVHDGKAWKCKMCQKMFSRPDAFRRHANASKARGPGGEPCTGADVIEVDLADDDRKANPWSSGASQGTLQNVYQDQPAVEEGEIQEQTIKAIQGEVLALHSVLQGLVGNVLNSHAQSRLPEPQTTGGSGSQATLASVIARAQSQNLPSAQDPAAMQGVAPTSVADSTQPLPSVDVEMAPPASDGNQEGAGSAAKSTPLTTSGLSDEQTRLLELAVVNAALAAQAQAEAEAALEAEDEEEEEQEEEEEEEEEEPPPPVPAPMAIMAS
ncbi:hypothetical protein BKA70DRAFT_1096165 [Coprinopsis sp. MPI-PUGE-AT-0042]|nr:hypothetical protein BKA70DRAFT_1096165 [Coprinopsis sp. MPI-PUGE-AT-0042]